VRHLSCYIVFSLFLFLQLTKINAAPVQLVLPLRSGAQVPADAQPVPLSPSLPLPLEHNETTFLASSLRGVKAEMEQVKEEARGTQAKMRGLEVKVRKMKKMKSQLHEMRERMRKLEDHNAQLSAALHRQQPQRSSPQTVGPHLGPSSRLGGRGEEGLWSEMLWCFPFLKHYGDNLPGRFVVDDHQYSPPLHLVMSNGE
jgi:hypothetical protein